MENPSVSHCLSAWFCEGTGGGVSWVIEEIGYLSLLAGDELVV